MALLPVTGSGFSEVGVFCGEEVVVLPVATVVLVDEFVAVVAGCVVVVVVVVVVDGAVVVVGVGTAATGRASTETARPRPMLLVA